MAENEHENDDLLVSYKQTLEGEWIATVPRYPEYKGRGLTEASAFSRLKALVHPQIVKDKAERKN